MRAREVLVRSVTTVLLAAVAASLFVGTAGAAVASSTAADQGLWSGLPAAVEFGAQVRSFGAYGNTGVSSCTVTHGSERCTATAGIGDCTVAAVGDLMQVREAEAGLPATKIPVDSLMQAFAAAGGTPSGGANEADVLSVWQSDGIDGSKIGSFFAADPGRMNTEAVIDQTGGTVAVVAIPESMSAAAVQSRVWTLANSHGAISSFHAIAIVGYSPRGISTVSGGRRAMITWSWWQRYAIETFMINQPSPSS